MVVVGHTVGEDSAGDLDSEVLLVLVGFLSRTLHDGATVWHDSVEDDTIGFTSAVDALVSAGNHHLVHYDLFGAEDDTVFADNADDSAAEIG